MALLSETSWDDNKELPLGFVRHMLAFPVTKDEDTETQKNMAVLLRDCVEATIKHYGSKYRPRRPSVTRVTQNGEVFDVVTCFIHDHTEDREALASIVDGVCKL